MDSKTLVSEETTTGAEFVAKFSEYMPVKAAFWAKPEESSQWYLYIASDQISGETLRQANGEVLRLTQEIGSPYLDPFQVKLLPADDPLAQAALAIQHRYPGKLPFYYNKERLGPMSIEGAYLYPTSVTLPST
jgi:hypothetical protein